MDSHYLLDKIFYRMYCQFPCVEDAFDFIVKVKKCISSNRIRIAA